MVWRTKYAKSVLVGRSVTVFGPLLMKPLLHMHGTFDSCNQYMNCISKMYCVLFLCIQQINACEPPFSGRCSFTSETLQFHFGYTAVSLWGHCSNGVVGLMYTLLTTCSKNLPNVSTLEAKSIPFHKSVQHFPGYRNFSKLYSPMSMSLVCSMGLFLLCVSWLWSWCWLMGEWVAMATEVSYHGKSIPTRNQTWKKSNQY